MSKIRLAYVALSVSFAVSAIAQVPTIIKEIDQLESQRDPKCYATANRLEDFIYGTSLDFDARAEKIALQKRLIRDVWIKATAAAKGKTQISVEELRPALQAAVPYVATPGGDWIVLPDTQKIDITARDKRQYGAVAYALRAILSVQQDAFVDGTNLLPLDEKAVELFKESVDLITLAALQHADRDTRTKNQHQINGAEMKAAWAGIVGTSKP
ncbi:MAG: hypothetical protein JO093_07085, partial [Acidobacteria bacterium]|nr:hypothetical protein [Acidobacteriota bacterium]